MYRRCGWCPPICDYMTRFDEPCPLIMARGLRSMTGERDDALPAEDRAVLAAAIVDPGMPDYLTIRALAALVEDERVARFSAMGRQFVADARRRAREDGAAALLAHPPSVLERVLETATRQLVRDAPHGLTMRTVSREAGIPRRTLYNLYATSDELVDACRRRAQTIWRARFEQSVLDGDPRPARRLLGVVDVARRVGAVRAFPRRRGAAGAALVRKRRPRATTCASTWPRSTASRPRSPRTRALRRRTRSARSSRRPSRARARGSTGGRPHAAPASRSSNGSSHARDNRAGVPFRHTCAKFIE